MKSAFIPVLGALAHLSTGHAAVPPASANAAPTNQLVIVCAGGATATPTNAIWRVNVRAADSQLYLECELLTALFKRQPSTNAAPVDGPPALQSSDSASDTNRARIDMIIAETNVLIITPELQVIGDRAVYTASNDVLRVTGDPVIVADARFSTICTNFMFDRLNNVITVEGGVATALSGSALSRTNTLPRKTNAPPAPK